MKNNPEITSSYLINTRQPSTIMYQVLTTSSQLTTSSTSGHSITSIPCSAQQLSRAVSTSVNIVAGQMANILQQLLMNTAGNNSSQPAGTPPVLFNLNQSASQPVNPFILKFETSQICVCQSFRQSFPNNLQLVVAQAECCLVQNMSTGTNFLGRESNSHYHLQLSCL